MCEEIFFIIESDWHHRGRTDRRSSAVIQRVEEIFYIIREAAPRSSTSTEPGGRTSCYFEFFSLQSRVVFVWGWLSLGVFGYRSPVEVDLHRQRIQENFYIDRGSKGGSEHQHRRIQQKICIGGESRQDHLIDKKRIKSGSSSARDRGDLLHHQRSGVEI